MPEVILDPDGTWRIVGLTPEQMAMLFWQLDDSLARFRQAGKCQSAELHARHAQVTILHSVMVEAAVNAQLPPSAAGVTVKA